MDNNGKTVVDDELLFEGLKRVWSGTLSLLGCRSDFTRRTGSDFFDENGQVMSLRHRTFDVRGTISSWKCVDSKREKILENG
jgi:anthranilate synthase component 2